MRRVVWHEMGLLVHARCGVGQRGSVGYLEDNNGVAVTSARVMRECRRVGKLKMHAPRLWNSLLALLNTRVDRLKTQYSVHILAVYDSLPILRKLDVLL